MQVEQVEVREFPNSTEQSRVAAHDWIHWLSRCSTPLLVAISGGRSAAEFFGEVARHRRLPAKCDVHFFWADERCVPPNSPDSNYWLADQWLFRPLAVPAGQIHRLRGELEPDRAVAEANTALQLWAAKNEEGIPILDLILLGVGEDGHVASLFPNAPDEVNESHEPYVAVSNSPKPPPHRISLSYAAITAARDVWVLVSGENKATALREALTHEAQSPLGRVLRSRRRTVIYTDIAL